ncbi:hypothetical protein NLJ89_g11957 [Agrocybe chaxingu]|uniref:Uncharacterized protein n=1 Tax=Agrocybe chaxingu TaxID=84603 RepID=A0A9W8JMS4_9AGAR|nr:hypothetical protein NLJ89_g11957 [Agrocybe chaxingu]
MASTKKAADDYTPVDINIPDNYVEHTLKTTKPLPPFEWKNWRNEFQWLSFAILTGTPIIGLIGAYYTRLRWETFAFSVFYYFVTGLGITAGYHLFPRHGGCRGC